ncbi:PEPxxWA-CTERM sorting domain-containing protein [Sphingobium sp. H33]|uniref:PEPxxWA-CTERM sorting domain-containing protein n=2 Tax=Sphingobium nicotianae TaxID=2782607 RepID=A0A9X1DFD0_9SPHN|nr:PEPxxWA-CTERM sorting domain-containing protein [Sphingobium nicotianae]
MGDFGPSQSHCIAPGQPYTGIFSFAFDPGNDLFGTTAGSMTPTATPGVFNSFVTYTVTGGTGRFLGASGSIAGVGLLDRRPARPLNHLDLTGTLNMPAVPEPATWGLMLTGLGLTGAAMRRRPARAMAVRFIA